jgi:hypothetical protein
MLSVIILSYAECGYAKCGYAECGFTECRYAECRYAKWRGTKLSHFSLPLMFSYRLQSKNFLLILTLWSNKLGRCPQDRAEHASLFCKSLKRQFCILMRLTLLGCILCNV